MTGYKMRKITLDAKLNRLDEVLTFVDSALEDLHCPVRAQMQLDVAVEELFVNIASYAYGSGVGPATIIIETEVDPPAVEVTFIDRGVPYNPLLKPDPDVTLSAEKRQIGGLGLFMVKKSMDDMTYEFRDGCNIVKIRKLLSPAR